MQWLIGTASDGLVHGGRFLSNPLDWLGEATEEAVKSNARIELFYLPMYFVKPSLGGVYGGGDVVDPYLHNLDLILEASGK